MSPADVAQLLKLPPGERLELAMVLWDSLSDEARAAEFALDEATRAELDRRWDVHLADPGSAVPWAELHRKLDPPA